MPNLIKEYPANTGMVNRDFNSISPFSDLVDVQITKNSLSSRAGYETLGALPASIDIYEMVEIEGNFYEILVTLGRVLYVFKNGIRVLTHTLRTYTGGRLSFSSLGNVAAIWDKAQTVAMINPTANPYPYEGFIVVTKTVDYGTTLQVYTEFGAITITIGDPLISGQAVVDATRGVDAVAKTIATGVGGAGGFTSAGAVINAALAQATAYWDALVEAKTKNQPAWDMFTTLYNNYNAVEPAYLALDLQTPAQRAMQHTYWLSLATEINTQINAIDVTGNPTYNPLLDYTVRANVNTLTASAEKTSILALIDQRDIYEANAAAVLIAPDNTAVIAAYTAAIQAIVDWLSYTYYNWWCGYIEDGDGFAQQLSSMMGFYLNSAAAFLVTGATRRYSYRGNVVYLPDVRNVTIITGEDYLTLIDGKVTSPLTLPRFAPLGTILKIVPIPGKSAATFVKAAPNNPNTYSINFLTEVAWEESADESQPFEWNQATLPSLLELVPSVQVFNTSTDIAPYWTKKKAGDTELCPNPLINGSKIVDITRGANRILLLGSNSSLTISELGKKENLFRISTLLLYPTDAFSTSIAGGDPTNLYKLAHWGAHIAILGGNSIFKFDLSNSIDATFPKITRAVSWSGKEALVASAESDLILVGEEMYALSYGTYGIRSDLLPVSKGINLPQNLIKVLYDPTRKAAYLLAPDGIHVGYYIKDNLWAWCRLTLPGAIVNGWLETKYLRLHCTNGIYGALLRLPLHPNLTLGENETYQSTDYLFWQGFWSGGSVPTSGGPFISVGENAGLTLSPGGNTDSTELVAPLLTIRGSEIPGVGRARLTRCQLKTRGICEVDSLGNLYSTQILRNRVANRLIGEKIVSTDNYQNLVIPVNYAGSLTKQVLTLVKGEISGIELLYKQGKANLGAAI